MAAPTIRQVMEGIQTRLQTIPGLRVAAVEPDAVSPPLAFVGVPPVDSYTGPFHRNFQITPTVTVYVSSASDRAGQLVLADYVNATGTTSIPAAITADPTLGGLVDSVYVLSFQPLGIEQVSLVGYYGGVFQLQVTASN
jgi:hypothetical protein